MSDFRQFYRMSTLFCRISDNYNIYYLYKGAGSSDNFNPNQYTPITILVARTQCVFPVSLRTGKRRARTTVKRIVISPADKQKQTTPTLSYYQSQSCCACIVSLEPGVIAIMDWCIYHVSLRQPMYCFYLKGICRFVDVLCNLRS